MTWNTLKSTFSLFAVERRNRGGVRHWSEIIGNPSPVENKGSSPWSIEPWRRKILAWDCEIFIWDAGKRQDCMTHILFKTCLQTIEETIHLNDAHRTINIFALQWHKCSQFERCHVAFYSFPALGIVKLHCRSQQHVCATRLYVWAICVMMFRRARSLLVKHGQTTRSGRSFLIHVNSPQSESCPRFCISFLQTPIRPYRSTQHSHKCSQLWLAIPFPCIGGHGKDRTNLEKWRLGSATLPGNLFLVRHLPWESP